MSETSTSIASELNQALLIDDIVTFKQLTNGNENIQSANYSITIKANKGVSDEAKSSSGNELPLCGLTLLHVAAYYDAIECFLYLHMTKHIPLDAKSASEYLPIHYSCWSGSAEITLYILKQNPTLATTYVEAGGSLQLIRCVIQGYSDDNTEILTTLLENGAKLGKNEEEQKSAILLAISTKKSKILEILMNHYQASTKNNSQIIPPAMLAAEEHNYDAFRLLYHHKKEEIVINTNLMYKNLVQTICEGDINYSFKKELINIIDDANEIVLEPPKKHPSGLAHWACAYCDVDVAKKIFDLPYFDPNRLENGDCALIKLINKTNDENCPIIAQMLIDKKLNLEPTTPDKPSILQKYATHIKKNIPVIDVLLKNGANMDAPYTKKPNTTIYQYVMSLRDNSNNTPLKEIFNKYRKVDH